MKTDHEAKAIAVSQEDADKAAGLFIQATQNITAGTLHNSGVMQQIHNYYGPPIRTELNPAEFPAARPLNGQSRFRAKGERLGVAYPFAPFGQNKEGTDVLLRDGPTLWLRVQPHERLPRELRVAELERSRYKLTTLLHSADHTVAAPDGFGQYRMAYDMGNAGAVSFFFRTGELWSIDSAGFFESEMGKFFAFHETREALFTHLPQFAEILSDAGIPAPYKWIAGVEQVEGYRLNAGRPGSMPYFDNTRFMVDRVIATGSYSPGDVPAEALDDFFEALFAECGASRPDHLVHRPERLT